MTKTKTMEENIKNYSNEIVTMTNFTEAVRESVGQFLGYRGNKGFINMIREIFQNSVDELMKDAWIDKAHEFIDELNKGI